MHTHFLKHFNFRILKIVISNDNKAKLLMIISALSFSIMAAVVKATSHSVAVKAFSRQIFSCIIVLSIIFINNNRIIPLKKNRIKLIRFMSKSLSQLHQ